MTGVLELWRRKVVVFDGAMGTTLQKYELTEDDFWGKEGCPEILCHSRPDILREIHAGYFAAGCDIVETNSFGGNTIVLNEYGLAGKARELARCAALIARGAANEYSTPARPRFVAGSVGPGTRLPSLGQIAFDTLSAAYLPQMLGLLDGGVDLIMIETCQDPLQVRAAVFAANAAMRQLDRKVPLLVSLTVEMSGAMLVGMELAAAAAALRPLGIDVLSLNCAAGPKELKRHVRELADVGPELLAVLPNAGLPENIGGRVHYSLSPDEFAEWTAGFVSGEGVGAVGGCCGTTADHIRALAQRVERLEPPRRTAQPYPAVSSLYRAVSLRQTPPPSLVAERTNANGSKEFRDKLLAGDIDGMLAVAREQADSGAHVIDLSVAYVGRDELADMTALVPLFAQQIDLPLMIDSTSPAVIEAALKLHGGRCIINSINLEDGREPLDQVAALAKAHGAAVIALTIDEQGMARSKQQKLAVAGRILQICTEDHGLAPSDLIFDLLTFTVASGDEDSRRAAVETLEAIAELKSRHPDVHVSLGVSNVSFGLKPGPRRILNSVFLDLAVRRGLDMAIVNARGILPVSQIDPGDAEAAVDLLLDRRRQGHDPLMAFIQRFQGRQEQAAASVASDVRSPEEKLADAIIKGRKADIAELLDRVLATGMAPLAIINTILIGAMKRVGELFGAGKMQLPFVLQSAEVMKEAVNRLEPLLDRAAAAERGTLVLATVKGDVHDIGKNLVDIILSNNGYRVVNIGIRVPLDEMLAAAEQHRTAAIGMSGLLVKSTQIMKENLEEMRRRGLSVPVLLGGAALTRRFVEEDLRAVYGENVYYGADAFDGLRIMDEISAGHKAERPTSVVVPSPMASSVEAPAPPAEQQPAPEIDRSVETPPTPFFGRRRMDHVPLGDIARFLNRTALIRGRWRYRRGALSSDEFHRQMTVEIEPLLTGLLQRCEREALLQPAAVYGYWPCRSAGNDVVVLDPAARTEVARLSFPRRRKAPHYCIADFFRPGGDPGGDDVIGLFVCTVGAKAMDEAFRLFSAARYMDYLHLHGLAVEMADALAELIHFRMRQEWGIDNDDAPQEQAIAEQGYRGSRYSFGYPACPDLAAQQPLFHLLQPGDIGIDLTESFLMVPEASVSAIVAHHPQARYFALD